jgi:hypothetical protein
MRMMRCAVGAAVVGLALSACSSSGGTPSGPVGATQKDVSFVVDGTATYGTLEVPRHHRGQRLAAALLVAGSGPTDRNGDQAGAGNQRHTLQTIAGVLDQLGVISLRFDKYFSGKTGFGRYAGDPSKITLSAFIDQADAAYDLLRRQPDVDLGQLTVVGHSEGGMYALLIAESVTPHPAGLALLEPQDDRDLNLIQLQTDEQLNAAVANGTLSADAARQNAATMQQAISDFRAGQPVDTSGLLPGIATLLNSLLTGTNANYTRTDDAVDPPAVAAKLMAGTRVLVTDGTSDPNIPPSTIGPLVQSLTAAGTTGPGLRTLSGLNHYLHPAGTPDTDAPIAPAAVDAIKQWAQPYATKQ